MTILQKLCKQSIPYLFFLLAGIFFLRMTDESRIPLTINASEMNRLSGYEDNTYIGLTPDSQYSGTMLASASYLLDPGAYKLGIAFSTNGEDDKLIVYDNGAELGSCKLDPDVTYQEYAFELERSCLDFRFEIEYSGTSNILIQSVTLIPEGQFYHDTAFLIAILTILTAAFALWRCYYNRTGRQIRDHYVAFTLIGIGFFASLPYLNTGLSWAVDLCYHLIRIEGIKDGLLAGQFPVVIYPEALHGNGYLNCMYPNLFLYLPAWLRMKGVSMADSFKCLVFLCNFVTAYLTYHCTKTIGGTTKAALLASLLYTCCPYRFTNIYARGAVGEFLAMAFFPLVFAGLYHIFIGDRKKWGYLVLGMTGLLQTHILSVTLAGIFCAVLSVIYLKKILLESRFLELAKAVAVSVLMNAGFLVPFLDFYQNGNLWMDALDLGTYEEYTMNLSGLFGLQLTGDYYMLTLGIPLAVCAVISLAYILLEQQPGEQEAYLRYLFLIGAFLIFMSLNFFPGWKMMAIPALEIVLKKIQFAWRLLGPASLLFAVVGSICCFRSQMLSKYSRILFVALAGICLFSATRFKGEDFAYSVDQEYTHGHVSKLIGIPKGANTVVYPFEWRPRHTIDAEITTETEISDSSQVNLRDMERTGTTTTLEYTCLSNDQYIEVPVIYYKDYAATDETGASVPLEKGKNNRIRILLQGDGKPHTVTLHYAVPASYTVSAWLSILTALLFVLIYIVPRLWNLDTVIRKEKKNVRQDRSSDPLLQ